MEDRADLAVQPPLRLCERRQKPGHSPKLVITSNHLSRALALDGCAPAPPSPAQVRSMGVLQHPPLPHKCVRRANSSDPFSRFLAFERALQQRPLPHKCVRWACSSDPFSRSLERSKGRSSNAFSRTGAFDGRAPATPSPAQVRSKGRSSKPLSRTSAFDGLLLARFISRTSAFDWRVIAQN